MNQLKILHVSDIHLEAKFSVLGEKAQEYRKQIVRTFESLFETAVENRVQLVLITGDLFDTLYPSRITKDIVKNLLQKFAKEGIYVAIIPGNHDYLAQGSVYLTENFAQNTDKIIVFNDPAVNKIQIDEIGVVLYANANTLQKSAKSPMPQKEENMTGPLPSSENVSTKGYRHIALVHGGLETVSTDTNYPIRMEDIKNSQFDYIALGDWHGMLDASQGKTKAFYPGSLEPLAIDQKNSGYVLLVEITDQTKITPVKVGKFQIESIMINTSELRNRSVLELVTSEIESFVKKGADPKYLMLNITLSGELALNETVSFEELTEYFRDKVFFIRFNNQLKFEISADEKKKYPEYTLLGKFIEYMEKKKQTAKDPTLIDEAIKKGINYAD